MHQNFKNKKNKAKNSRYINVTWSVKKPKADSKQINKYKYFGSLHSLKFPLLSET